MVANAMVDGNLYLICPWHKFIAFLLAAGKALPLAALFNMITMLLDCCSSFIRIYFGTK